MGTNVKAPYLSVVVSSRNDNHGGDLLQRMQTFINGLAALCGEYQLPVELIVVEWNPPEDREPLEHALQWPQSQGFCSYRMVQVPPELHRQLDTSEGLPLFQMIAKNVGIHRATAPFVVATNIDLIFSEELISWLASRPLRKGHFYRVDRYDVPAEVMQLSNLDDQLRYCEKNLLRVHCRYGTIPGREWPSQPGPAEREESVSRFSFRLPFSSNPDDVIFWRKARKLLERRSREIPSNFLATMLDASIRRIGRWSTRLATDSIQRANSIALSICRHARYLSEILRWKNLRKPNLELSEVLHRNMLRLLLSYRWLNPYFRLHTNACGDFTLMAKSDWESLTAYAEFEMYSWHIDSLLIHAAHYAGMVETVVPFPLYHIEHSGGWSPSSEKQLFGRLRAGNIPYLTNQDLLAYDKEMGFSIGRYQFNDLHWGFQQHSLPDSLITAIPSTADTDGNPETPLVPVTADAA